MNDINTQQKLTNFLNDYFFDAPDETLTPEGIAKAITDAYNVLPKLPSNTNPGKEPVQSQLKSPDWWDQNAPEWAELGWVVREHAAGPEPVFCRITWTKSGFIPLVKQSEGARSYSRPRQGAA